MDILKRLEDMVNDNSILEDEDQEVIFKIKDFKGNELLDNFLIKSIEKNNINFVKLFIGLGADIHADNDYAFCFASENGHTEIVKLLLDWGADIHADDDYALRWASEKGHTETAKLLLDRGADIHAKDDYAIRWASHNGHTGIVKILKEYMKKENR